MGTQTGGKSVGSAVLGILLTLGIFVLTFVGFLLAPLALLLVAFLVWTVMRPREGSEPVATAPSDATDDGVDEEHRPHRGRSSTTDFGAGAR
jgi:predicted lipid-binding transport protein (Tim44 family)